MCSWCAFVYTAMVVVEGTSKMGELCVTHWIVEYTMSAEKLHMSWLQLLRLPKLAWHCWISLKYKNTPIIGIFEVMNCDKAKNSCL